MSYITACPDGGLPSLGNTHAGHGNGEVCGTAIECTMDVTILVYSYGHVRALRHT